MVKKRKLLVIMLLVIMLSFLIVSCDDDIPSVIKGNENELGIKIEGGDFDKDATLVVEKITDEAIVSEVEELMADIDYNKDKKLVIFDISVVKDNVELQPNGKIKVTIPVPKKDVTNYLVYHVSGDKVEELSATIENNNIIFETTSFSYFVIVEKEEHTHSYGNWEKVDDLMHVKKCNCGDMIR